MRHGIDAPVFILIIDICASCNQFLYKLQFSISRSNLDCVGRFHDSRLNDN